jgi:hypothetical protein
MATQSEIALEQYKLLIAGRLGWGDPASWTSEDFESLSERIFETTAVRLSVSTLKRIWGKVRYDSSPTTATLNALARYAGFEGWRDFLQQSTAVAPPQPAVTDITPQPDDKPRPRTAALLIVITIAAAALLSLLSARLIRPAQRDLPVTFESRPTSDDLPNSVVFDYDATPLHPKELIIQQSWDPRRREKLDPDSKQHTSIYFYPGYFVAKLIVDGEIKKESRVFIPTKGWRGILHHKPMPIYLSPQEIRTGADAPIRPDTAAGTLGISAETLRAKLGSTIFTGIETDFTNVRLFPGITGEHFSLETTVRNTSSVEECLCRNVTITVLGQFSAIIIPLSDKGCIANLSLLAGFTQVNGKDHDLSAFGCDFTQWQHVKCTEANHVLNIILNDRSIYTLEKARSIGDIVGIRISFEGAGAIQSASLQGAGEKIDLMP